MAEDHELAIGIAGCGGRMGRMLLATVLDSPGCRLAGGSARPGSTVVGRDLGELAGRPSLGLTCVDDAATLFAAADAVIDFTRPENVAAHASLAADHGTLLVVGTTGLAGEQEATLKLAAESVPVVYAPNMSLGITLLLRLVEQVAGALDPDFDIEILEMHHRHKIDAPSGTALGLGAAAARGRRVSLDAVARRVRDGQIGARIRGEIGFATLRGGDVVGEHCVIFAGDGERVEISHKASSRSIFARGAVKAALWAARKPAGLYGMEDVLGL